MVSLIFEINVFIVVSFFISNILVFSLCVLVFFDIFLGDYFDFWGYFEIFFFLFKFVVFDINFIF